MNYACLRRLPPQPARALQKQQLRALTWGRAFGPSAPFSLRARPATGEVARRPMSTSQYARQQQREDARRGKKTGHEQPERRQLDEHEQQASVKEHQVKRPWHRKDADEPPVSTNAEKEREKITPENKGKVLTTPTRLLKIILPLPISIEKDKDNNSRDYGRAISQNDTVQPLALLVHPQQPLSYVERLIQAELPPVLENGREKIPNVYFRAEDTSAAKSDQQRREKPRSPHVASYSGLGHEAPKGEDAAEADKRWLRWSSSTEMGDFIRDAARGREFAVELEGYNVEMRVGVPSFGDRTYYMRARLRRMSRHIEQLGQIKRECDMLAHRGAYRLAKSGLAALAGWWAVVYYVTFHTEFGWDLVEPVTYLAGLGTIMGGYLWFLYISREVSYKAAMNITVSRRQGALYESRGFDLHKWESLVAEANTLRRDIKAVAMEYDVDWDEIKDLGDEAKEVLEKERKGKGKGGMDPPESDESDEFEDESNKKDDSGKSTEEKKAEKK